MEKLTDGFKAAFSGLKETLIYERNFRIMVVISILVIVAMFYFDVSRLERVALLLTIFSVLTLELINSTIERVMDFLEPREDERVRIIKNLMAAIVLFACIGAAIIGFLIFLPYLFR